MMIDAPVSPLSQSVSPLVMAASGLPRTRNISPPTIKVANSGMMTTGMSPRSRAGIFHLLIQSATKPAIRPPTRPPMKPAPTNTATAPAVKPGARPGLSAMA